MYIPLIFKNKQSKLLLTTKNKIQKTDTINIRLNYAAWKVSGEGCEG